jgi:ABC-type nitrate/sulfonate/bicarbonate transport system substrate-binding protein
MFETSARSQPFAFVASVVMTVVVACGPAATPSPSPTSSAQASSSAAPTPLQPATLKIGVGVNIPAYAQADKNLSEEFFQAQKLTVENVTLQGDPTVIAAVQNGDVNMGLLVSNGVPPAVEAGRSIIAIYSVNRTMPMDMVVSQKFLDRAKVSPSDDVTKRLAALKEGKFGTVSLGGVSETMPRYLVKVAGGDPAASEIVAMGSAPQLITGVAQGLIDGFMLSPPTGWTVEAQSQGKILLKGSEIRDLLPYEWVVVVARQDWAKANGDLIRRYARALSAASDFMTKDTKGAAERLKKSYPIYTQELLERSVKFFADLADQRGRMSVQGWDNVLKVEEAVRGKGKLTGATGQGVWWTNEYLQ